MSTIELIAVFESAVAATKASRGLRQRLGGGVTVRISAEFLIHVRVAKDELAATEEALRAMGARKVTARDADSAPSWMSHHDGRVTGTGVAPGAGDAEAGASGD